MIATWSVGLVRRLGGRVALSGLGFIAGRVPRALPLYVVFIFLVWRKAKRKDALPLPPAGGSGSGADVIVLPLDLLSPKPSQIHPRFCVPNSNRCQSDVSNPSARIRKNESEHNRTYD